MQKQCATPQKYVQGARVAFVSGVFNRNIAKIEISKATHTHFAHKIYYDFGSRCSYLHATSYLHVCVIVYVCVRVCVSTNTNHTLCIVFEFIANVRSSLIRPRKHLPECHSNLFRC